MALEDETVSAILAGDGVEQRRRTALNLIDGPSIVDRPAIDRIDLDFWGTVRVGAIEIGVGYGDIAVADVAASVDIGDIPADAHVLGYEVRLSESFSGGGASLVTLDVGPATAPSAIIASADLFAAPVDGACSSAPAGISPYRRFAASTTLVATFQADAFFDTLTAGHCTVRVLYVIPAAT